MALSSKDKLSAAIIKVMDPGKRPNGQPIGCAPYFGSVLRGLIRREIVGERAAIMEALGLPQTLAVSEDAILWWSAKFVEKTPLDELVGVLVHEVMHIVLKHAARATALGIKPTVEDFSNAQRWNKAADLAINSDVRKMASLPKDGLFPEKFGFPDGLTAEAYYKLLEQQEKEKQKGGQDGGKKTLLVTNGHCGGCAQHPIPGEPPPAGSGGTTGEGRSQAEMARILRATAESVKDYSSKNRGTVPASLDRWADEQLAPPKIPWRTKLARSVRGAVAYRAGATDYTWNKMSRRQSGVGFGPGRPVIPALHAPQPEVAVVIDTSGSMGEDALSAALAETQGVLRAVGANITLCICDATVHGIRPIARINDARKMLKGGGGTAMAPALEAVAKLKNKPSVCIVVTDGYIDHPPKPECFSVIWCIIGGNTGFEMPYGDVVFVDEEAGEKAA